MLRPLAIIASAILISRPDLGAEDVKRFASILQEEAAQRGFDPLSAVAIVHFESAWQPEVISPNGEDYGLGQIRARYIGACRADSDPRDNPSASCAQVKKSLLDAETNLRTMAELIANNKKLCQQKGRSASLPNWLASYQGLNFPKQGKWCQPNDKTWQVVKYRSFLITQVTHPKKPAKAAPKKPAKAAPKKPAKAAPKKPAKAAPKKPAKR